MVMPNFITKADKCQKKDSGKQTNGLVNINFILRMEIYRMNGIITKTENVQENKNITTKMGI